MTRLASKHSTATEAIVVALLALALYLPFLAIQYDTNGISEAAALESGQLVNKNHMLYRPVGLLVYRAAQMLGYHGNSLYVLQVLNAMCGSIGVGLAYALFKFSTRGRAAAALGCFWLATSFVYWIFSTDAAYITLAGTLALGAMVCIAYSKSSTAVIASGILLSLSILTWQAGIFLVPTALMFMIAGAKRPVFHDGALLLVTIGLTAGPIYLLTAYTLSDARSPAGLWAWFTNYSEGPALPLWGVWSAGRFETAAVSALRSVVPVLLAIRPSAITRSVQLGESQWISRWRLCLCWSFSQC